MRELELLLSTFLDDRYDSLSDSDQASFESLLAFTDDQLIRWLTGRVIPDDPTVSGIIAKITSTGARR